MSRFFSPRHAALEPYVPGEQPRDQVYIKLNTNESPFPPSPKAAAMSAEAAKTLQLYSDPECRALKEQFTKVFGIPGDRVLFTNGSDETLYFLFLAFCDEEHGAAFPWGQEGPRVDGSLALRCVSDSPACILQLVGAQ